jgi:hypothetical protein
VHKKIAATRGKTDIHGLQKNLFIFEHLLPNEVTSDFNQKWILHFSRFGQNSGMVYRQHRPGLRRILVISRAALHRTNNSVLPKFVKYSEKIKSKIQIRGPKKSHGKTTSIFFLS